MSILTGTSMNSLALRRGDTKTAFTSTAGRRVEQ